MLHCREAGTQWFSPRCSHAPNALGPIFPTIKEALKKNRTSTQREKLVEVCEVPMSSSSSYSDHRDIIPSFSLDNGQLVTIMDELEPKRKKKKKKRKQWLARQDMNLGNFAQLPFSLMIYLFNNYLSVDSLGRLRMVQRFVCVGVWVCVCVPPLFSPS